MNAGKLALWRAAAEKVQVRYDEWNAYGLADARARGFKRYQEAIDAEERAAAALQA